MPGNIFRTILGPESVARDTRDAGFSGAILVAELLDASLVGAPISDGPGRIVTAIASGSARNLRQALEQLNPSDRNALRARWGHSLDELVSLSQESDARIFHNGMFQIGQRLEESDEELSGRVYAALVAGSPPLPDPLPQGERGLSGPSPLAGEGGRRPGEGAAPAGIIARAHRRLNAIAGVGDWRERFAFSLQRLPERATRWDTLLAMTGAGLTFRGFRLWTSAAWAGSFESAWALNTASASTAFLAETVAFTGLGRIAGSLAGRPHDPGASALFNEWAGGAAMLLGLKGMGGLTGAGVRSIYGEGLAATATGRLTQILAPQAGMFMGILVGNRLAEIGGFHPERRGDTWLTDAVTTLIEFNIAGRLQRSAGGPGLTSLEGRMAGLTRSLGHGSGRTGEIGDGRSKDRPLRDLFSWIANSIRPEFATAEGLPFPSFENRQSTIENLDLVLQMSKAGNNDDSGVRPIPTAPTAPARRDPAIHRLPTQILEVNRISRPAARPPGPTRPVGSPLAYFEYVYDPQRRFLLKTPHEGAIVSIGRATEPAPNLFPTEFRGISRRHMELRWRESIPEIRSAAQALGLKVNEVPLAADRWYRLADGDLVEFISQARIEWNIWKIDEHHEGLVESLHRLGERDYRGGGETADAARPPVFRFRLIPPPVETAGGGMLQRTLRSIRGLFENSSETPRQGLPESDRPPPAAPRPAWQEPELFWTEMHRFTESVHGALALFEAGLRSEEVGQDTRASIAHAPHEILGSLLKAHQRFFGDSLHNILVEDPETHAYSTLKVPYWSRRALHLLGYYEAAVSEIRRESPFWPRLQAAENEIPRMKQYFLRLHEVVRRYQLQFHDPRHQAMLAALESAYHGLHPPTRIPGERVRSLTRGLDVFVSPHDRLSWIANFRNRQPSSLAMLNAQILMREVLDIRGRRVVSSFYQALASSTIHEGIRWVPAYYDRDGGEIVGFMDGTRAAWREIAALQKEGRSIEEIRLLVDVAGSGTITDITGISAKTRESLSTALRELRGLQVLPEASEGDPIPAVPEATTQAETAGNESAVVEDTPAIVVSPREFWGSDALGTGDHAAYWRIALDPATETPAGDRKRIIGITPPRAAPDGSAWRLITFEAPDPTENATVWQLWVPEDWTAGLRVGAIVAVTPYY